jgi:hypothetical protein
MERGLSEAALAEVKWLFAGQQAIAQDPAGAAQDNPAEMVLRVADEQIGDVIRVVELELPVAGQGDKAADVAVASRVLLVKSW